MKEFILDGQLMTSREALYLHLKRVFHLPNYFGDNLDALWDVLNEEKEPTEIVFVNVNQALEHLENDGKALIKLLERLAEYNEYYKISFKA